MFGCTIPRLRIQFNKCIGSKRNFFQREGLSTSLLPLFGDTAFGQAQRERIKNTDLTQLGYYNHMLLLFGQGWDEKRYAFDAQGQLNPAWIKCQ